MSRSSRESAQSALFNDLEKTILRIAFSVRAYSRSGSEVRGSSARAGHAPAKLSYVTRPSTNVSPVSTMLLSYTPMSSSNASATKFMSFSGPAVYPSSVTHSVNTILRIFTVSFSNCVESATRGSTNAATSDDDVYPRPTRRRVHQCLARLAAGYLPPGPRADPRLRFRGRRNHQA